MSKNVTLWGASYSNVPAINVPQTGGGTARFTDTSPTTAVDADVAQGKIYFKADGTQSTGTGSGGGGGGSSDVSVGEAFATAVSSDYLIFDNLHGVPTSCFVISEDALYTGSANFISSIVWDGGDNIGSFYTQVVSNTTNQQVRYIEGGSYASVTADSITFYTANQTYFPEGQSYMLVYSYKGTASDIDTKTQSVGSGATSITFSGLSGTPLYWGVIFLSYFSTSSGYQRVMAVGSTSQGDISGLEMSSSANNSATHWSASYNNGSLTITSQGTNAGGYFHQPGNYLLVYAYDSGGGGGGITPTGNIDITQAGVTDVTNYATATVPSATYDTFKDWYYSSQSGQLKFFPEAWVEFGENGGWVNGETVISTVFDGFDAIPTGTSVTPTKSTQTIGGADTMMRGAVTVNPIPSEYIVPTGNIAITSNTGTGQTIDVSQYATATVNVAGDAVTGTLTVASNVNTSTSTAITTTSAIGFTPTKFFFWKESRTATSNHVHQATFTTMGSYYIRTMTRYSSNALSTSGNTNNWTTQTAGYLYYNSNTIYFRSSSSYILSSGTWHWVAVK